MRDALLEALFASGSNLLILPIQDVFGWRDRINQPATVGDQNWTWRLPWPSDRLLTQPEAIAVALQLRVAPNATAARSYRSLPLIFAHVSLSVTVRLKTGVPGAESGSTQK